MNAYLTTLISLFFCVSGAIAQLPNNCQQVVVGITQGNHSSHVSLAIYNKVNGTWQQSGQTWQGRLGKNGVAWGIGLHPTQQGLQKKEGDKRSPMGIFAIGGAYGYANTIQKHKQLYYKKITSRDLWVEDPISPYYNRHILLRHEPSNRWEKKAQMRQGDPAHALKLFIAHNEATKTKAAKPYAGSSIFFHIWRNQGANPSAGCTTMEGKKLQTLVRAIDPTKKPCYVLLSFTAYQKHRSTWKLP